LNFEHTGKEAKFLNIFKVRKKAKIKKHYLTLALAPGKMFFLPNSKNPP
jgi:hypothetical protein